MGKENDPKFKNHLQRGQGMGGGGGAGRDLDNPPHLREQMLCTLHMMGRVSALGILASSPPVLCGGWGVGGKCYLSNVVLNMFHHY